MNRKVFPFKHSAYNCIREKERNKNTTVSFKSVVKLRNSNKSSRARLTSTLKSFTKERSTKKKLMMSELPTEAALIHKKHTSKYLSEKLELSNA